MLSQLRQAETRKSILQTTIPTPVKYASSSEDDDRWELNEDPMVNVFTFGWTEDGRLGYQRKDSAVMQPCPCPVAGLRVLPAKKKTFNQNAPPPKQFICKKVSAGSRHSLFLMIDCSKNMNKLPPKRDDDDDYDSGRDNKAPPPKFKRQRKIMISGLNHVGLCEDPGFNEPVDVPWDESFDRPVDVIAGRGASFVITKNGHLYSWGFGKFGVLGHGDTITVSLPRRIFGLERKFVTKVGVGAFHAIALTDENILYSWGRNSKGQLGIGFESDQVLNLAAVTMPQQVSRAPIVDVSCGFEHSVILMNVTLGKADEITMIYAWGDDSKGQLGSGDKEMRFKPQENRYISKLLRKYDISIVKVVAGGHHNLALVRHSGQVISWGGNEYGQLGHGNLFNSAEPKLINNLEKVVALSAGLRHSAAVCEARTIDVLTWGYNGFGELGLGDTDIRLQPTKISAIKNSKVLQTSCGDRHTAFMTSHRPIYARDLPVLRPYFRILAVSFCIVFLQILFFLFIIQYSYRRKEEVDKLCVG
jgi:alpha-tubulin suppressor-like RCC1 family protein